MGLTGYVKTKRFRNHSKTSEPSAAIIRSHYSDLIKANIETQTGTAGWFLAELFDRPTFGGVNGELYVIYNPTDSKGNPVTSDSVASAKACGAPCPPFCDEESVGMLIFDQLARIEAKIESMPK